MKFSGALVFLGLYAICVTSFLLISNYLNHKSDINAQEYYTKGYKQAEVDLRKSKDLITHGLPPEDSMVLGAVNSALSPIAIIKSRVDIDKNNIQYVLLHNSKVCHVLITKNLDIQPERKSEWLIEKLNCR